jgi:putative redox protein
MVQITIDRVEGDYGFEAKDALGHTVKIDSSIENGGSNYGTRPTQLLLMGLGTCSGIDIVAILKKQKQPIDNFKMHIKGQREKDKTPALWEKIHVLFELTGDIDEDKAKRACALSIDKYCSVAETLRRAGATISWEVKVNSAIGN